MPTATQIEADFRGMLAEWGESFTPADASAIDAILDVVRSEPVDEPGGERTVQIGTLTWWGSDLEGVEQEAQFTRAADSTVWVAQAPPITEDGVTMVDVKSSAQRRAGRH